jgi:hypothetical protein
MQTKSELLCRCRNGDLGTTQGVKLHIQNLPPYASMRRNDRRAAYVGTRFYQTGQLGKVPFVTFR